MRNLPAEERNMYLCDKDNQWTKYANREQFQHMNHAGRNLLVAEVNNGSTREVFSANNGSMYGSIVDAENMANTFPTLRYDFTGKIVKPDYVILDCKQRPIALQHDGIIYRKWGGGYIETKAKGLIKYLADKESR